MAWLPACQSGSPSTETGVLGLCAECQGTCLEEFGAPVSSQHVTGGVEYSDPPPSSGDHDPCWARWGAHTNPVPDENWVHNLEHGGVVFLFDCPGDCTAQVADLTDLVEDLGSFALLTPYSPMPARFAAVSWGWRYVTDCYEREAFESFYQRHVDRGPESVASNPDAACM